MARKKLNLAYIGSDTKRKAAYKKRKTGLFKKTYELCTLCDVEACAIIYSPDKPEPDVWPSHPDAYRVIHKFKSMPEFEQSKKMLDQESFQTKRIEKGKEQLRKMQFENRKKEMDNLIVKCLCIGNFVVSSDANDLKWMIGQRLVEIEQKKARDQFQPGFVLGANNNNGAGEALNMQQNAVAPMMGHDEGLMLLTNNVNDNAAAAAAMHNQDWSMDSLPAANNNGGGNQMFSYGNYHLPYGYVGGPSSSNA